MLKQQALKKSFTTLTILTLLSIIFQGSLIVYQTISKLTGINTIQQVYQNCSQQINTILSNSNMFYLIAVIVLVISFIVLCIMLMINIRGLCNQAKDNQQKFMESKESKESRESRERPKKLKNVQENMQVFQVNQNNKDLNKVYYFTSSVMVAGSVLYFVAFITILCHFGLFLTISITFNICFETAYVNLILISVLSLISSILSLISFIIWQIQQKKLKQFQSSQKSNQLENQNRNNNKKYNNQAGQNVYNLQTIYPFNNEQQQSNNKNKLNKSKNIVNQQYVTFNGKNPFFIQNQNKNKQIRDNTEKLINQKSKNPLRQSQQFSKSSKSRVPSLLQQYQEQNSNYGNKNQKQKQKQRELSQMGKIKQKRMDQSNKKIEKFNYKQKYPEKQTSNKSDIQKSKKQQEYYLRQIRKQFFQKAGVNPSLKRPIQLNSPLSQSIQTPRQKDSKQDNLFFKYNYPSFNNTQNQSKIKPIPIPSSKLQVNPFNKKYNNKNTQSMKNVQDFGNADYKQKSQNHKEKDSGKRFLLNYIRSKYTD